MVLVVCTLLVTGLSCSSSKTTSYWDIKYDVVGGRIMLNYSLANTTAIKKVINLNESYGITLTMQVNKSVVNGTREVIINSSSGWVFPALSVSWFAPGVDMNLNVTLSQDAVGTLYVKNGVADVDESSQSYPYINPIQQNIFGGGAMSPAGSLVMPMVLEGSFITTAGPPGDLPFDLLTFTTGNSSNVIHMPTDPQIDGATVVSKGIPFAQTGGVADYIGTNGTITTTGTGNCLGIKIAGFPIDLQVEITLVLAPATK